MDVGNKANTPFRKTLMANIRCAGLPHSRPDGSMKNGGCGELIAQVHDTGARRATDPPLTLHPAGTDLVIPVPADFRGAALTLRCPKKTAKYPGTEERVSNLHNARYVRDSEDEAIKVFMCSHPFEFALLRPRHQTWMRSGGTVQFINWSPAMLSNIPFDRVKHECLIHSRQ